MFPKMALIGPRGNYQIIETSFMPFRVMKKNWFKNRIGQNFKKHQKKQDKNTLSPKSCLGNRQNSLMNLEKMPKEQSPVHKHYSLETEVLR